MARFLAVCGLTAVAFATQAGDPARHEMRTPGARGRPRIEYPPIRGSSSLTISRQGDSGAGTMHFAGRTEIRAPDAGPREALVFDAREEPPLFDHVLDNGDGSWLLLAWSSYGAGYQDVHVNHVGGRPLRGLGGVTWHTPRAYGCVLLQKRDGGWRLGLPRPRDDDEETRLIWGRRLLAGGKLRKAVAFAPAEPAPDVYAYCPPFGGGLSLQGEVGWITPFVENPGEGAPAGGTPP